MKTEIISFMILLDSIGSGLSLNENWIANVNFERNFIQSLEDYIENQESVLQLLRKKLLNFKVEVCQKQ